MSRTLDVWFRNIKCGELIQEDSGRLSFSYNDEYLKSAGADAISISMPLSDQKYDDRTSKPYFSGLLPDDIVRKRLAKQLGVSERNPFSLLEAVGGECAGAISLHDHNETPEPVSTETEEELDGKKLDEIFESLKRKPLLVGRDDIRLSLAGAQNKLAVKIVDGNVSLAHGGAPTTHILKPPIDDIGDVEDSVQNELFCLTLASKMGFPCAKAELRRSEKNVYLAVERYDRVWVDGQLKRLHQEDFCQALSIPPENKYEKEGGPSVEGCLELIQAFSENPLADRRQFLNLLIFNFLIGNADAHGKNFSILFKDGIARLAPAYDLLSTEIYPSLGKKMAMKIGGKYDPNDVFLRHWHKIIPETATAKNVLEKDLKRISSLCLEQGRELKSVLEEQGFKSPVYEKIMGVIERRSERLYVQE